MRSCTLIWSDHIVNSAVKKARLSGGFIRGSWPTRLATHRTSGEISSLTRTTVDYKPAELINKFYPHLAIPGLDFAGRIVKPASGSTFEVGDLVFGVAGTSPVAGGALAEYAVVAEKHAVALPEGVSMIDASTCGVAALTAWVFFSPRHSYPGVLYKACSKDMSLKTQPPEKLMNGPC